MASLPPIWMIGCGNMGGAVARAIQDHTQLHAIKPSPLPGDIKAQYYPSVEEADLSSAQICILAVKPQKLDKICEKLAGALPHDCLIISIAAGKTLEGIGQHFPDNQPILRAMPNTPAMIGEGMSVLCANTNVSGDQRVQAQQIFEACGKVEWLEDESLMDAITAISGSGPAYLFYFIEALEAAAKESGFTPDMAAALTRQTVIGAAALAADQDDMSPGALRQNVTSPGGTTEAALGILMQGEFQDILKKAVGAAIQRGKDLS